MLAPHFLSRVTRRVLPSSRCQSSLSSSSPLDNLTLYQYAICPFCNKVKALLDYTGVPYTSTEVNPLSKAEIKWSRDYKKVPIATAGNDTVIKGSDEIVEFLLKQDIVQEKIVEKYKNDIVDFDSLDARSWAKFAQDELASLLYPNICKSISDSYQAFGYVHNVPTFSTFQRYSIQSIGSVAMYMAASKVKQKRNITDERQALEDVLQILEEDGLKGCTTGNSNDSGSDYMFLSQGNKPNLGDVIVYGTLRAIEGLPAHTEAIMQRENRAIPEWYERMKLQMK